jgi:purine-binding chemotaxis protein CheW
MTDDTPDDRMDRARRIREMREGSRQDDTPSDGDSGDGPEDAADWFDDPDGGEDATGASESTETGGPVEADGSTATADTSDAAGAADAADAADADDEESPFGDGVPQVPGMDIDDASVDADTLAAQAGLGTDTADGATAESVAPGAATGETTGASPADAGDTVGMGAARSAGAVTGTTAENETRVLEFALGDERYCLDIEYVEEIVKRETVTRVPNTPDYVAGVVDLRGQITTILDPKVIFDIDVDGSEDLIVVFDPDGFDDQGAIGWLVDDVNQVMPVADSEVNPSPVEQDHVEGVVDRDGEFVIWTTPEIAVEDATG